MTRPSGKIHGGDEQQQECDRAKRRTHSAREERGNRQNGDDTCRDWVRPGRKTNRRRKRDGDPEKPHVLIVPQPGSFAMILRPALTRRADGDDHPAAILLLEGDVQIALPGRRRPAGLDVVLPL